MAAQVGALQRSVGTLEERGTERDRQHSDLRADVSALQQARIRASSVPIQSVSQGYTNPTAGNRLTRPRPSPDERVVSSPPIPHPKIVSRVVAERSGTRCWPTA